MMITQALLAVLSTRGGMAGTAGAARLTVLSVGGTVGMLAETVTYRVLSPKTLLPEDPRSGKSGDHVGNRNPIAADGHTRWEAPARSEARALKEQPTLERYSHRVLSAGRATADRGARNRSAWPAGGSH
jgi:hypothetical protein